MIGLLVAFTLVYSTIRYRLLVKLKNEKYMYMCTDKSVTHFPSLKAIKLTE